MNNRNTGGEVYGRGDQENARVLRTPNDIEFSGERKRVRCNEGLDGPATNPTMPQRRPCRAEVLAPQEARRWPSQRRPRSVVAVRPTIEPAGPMPR